MQILWQIMEAIRFTTLEMAPYLLFGFAVAGLLHVWVPADKVRKHLGGKGFWSVFKAAVVGVPLPLCSCSVIPVAASLRKHGASRGATASFLLSTPQTGVDSIMVTYSLLGPVFAIFRPIVEFISGIIGGLLVEWAGGQDETPEEKKAQECLDDCCLPGNGGGSWFYRAVKFGFYTLPRDLVRPMVVGLIVSGIISALVPDDFFKDKLGAGLPAMLAVLAISVPLYVCATASVPIAMAMILKGITPGAALVFLVAGPAVNATTVAAIWHMLGRRAAFVYLAVVAVMALGAGLLLDAIIFSMPDMSPIMMHHHAGGEWFKVPAAVIMLGVFSLSILPGKNAGKTAHAGSTEKDKECSCCDHCESDKRSDNTN